MTKQRFFGLVRTVSVVVRLILVFRLLPPEWNDWISFNKSSLRSIVALPTFTLENIREAAALRRLVDSPFKRQPQLELQPQSQHERFADAYRGGGGQAVQSQSLPPLLLAALEALLRLVVVPDGTAAAAAARFSSKEFYERVTVGILLLLVDLWISRLLEIILASALGMMVAVSVDHNKTNMNDHHDDEDDEKTEWMKEEDRLQLVMPDLIRPKFAHIFPIDHKEQHVAPAYNGDKETTREDQSTTNSNPLVIYRKDLPRLVANLYLASPVTMLATSVFCCFQNLRTLALLLALCEAWKEPPRRRNNSSPRRCCLSTCALAMAMATYLDVTFVVFIIPLGLLQWQRRRQQKAASVMLFLFFWAVSLLSLHVFAFLLVGKSLRNYALLAARTILHPLRLANLTPSLSILWYTQMQLFGRFAAYFQIIFAALPFILVTPIAIRLYRYPLVLVTIYWLVWTLFRPTGTLYDLNVGLCLMLMSPRSLARMNVTVCLIATCALVVPVTLYVVLYWMWLETGNGEANFLYFQCYAYNVFVAILFIQFTGASVERDKALRLTIKEQQQEKIVDNEESSKEKSESCSKGGSTL